MRYTYAYKTSDGVRHEESMDAESREAVFATLRAKGIKAIKVVAADGSKANGETRGVRKRVVTVAVVLACAITATLTVIILSTPTPSTYTSGDAVKPRHQIYGDPAILAAFERGNFALAFTNRFDQMLAWFAQPGRLLCPRGVDPRRLAWEFEEACRKSGEDAASPLSGEDPREVRELKQIVNGMREELREYLANGNGTPRSYWRRLLQRTQQEMQIYERTRRELEEESDAAVWERKNAALRQLGLRSIPNPNEDD